YVAYAPQLFDLHADPEETTDLAGDPRYRAQLAESERRLRRVLDHEAADALAPPRRPRGDDRARRRPALSRAAGRERAAPARGPRSRSGRRAREDAPGRAGARGR